MLPRVTSFEFNRVLRIYGSNMILKQQVKDSSCTCFDPNHQSYDDLCELCAGTGSITQWRTKTIRGMIFTKAERSQGYHQTLYTKGGPVTTNDATCYIEGKHWSSEGDPEERTGVKQNDGIIFQEIEYRVVSVLPRILAQKIPIFILLSLERHPYQLTTGSVVNNKL
jgi:hypothetical protein